MQTYHQYGVGSRSVLQITIQVGKKIKEKKRESFWIRELRTLHPKGINKKAYIFFFNFLNSSWSLASW
jgi:hypothetical protein